jgi:heme/copper-type cytochrome/quinol oxidase subunit 4
MEPSLTFALYIVYALVQAVLVARYFLELTENDSPVFAVVLMTIFAPLVSIGMAITAVGVAIEWLVTYRGKKSK